MSVPLVPPSTAPIGRQLHDIVIPQLFALATGLAALRRNGSHREDDAFLRDLEDTAARALCDLRSISRGHVARPTRTIAETLRTLASDAQAFSQLTGCRIEVVGTGDAPIPPALADDLAAACWEGIVNGARHGRAGHVRVEIGVHAGAGNGRRLAATVVDDGCWKPARDGLGTGLAGLRQRAATWGGVVEVDGSDTGTRLTWSVPVPIDR